MRAWMAAAVAVGLASGLAACDNPKRALGLEKAAPDEFAVVTRAPLSLPPDFSLRPPEPGAPRPQEGTTRDQARRVITGGPAILGGGPIVTSGPLTGGQSPGEQALLQQAGSDRAIPNIRRIVDQETSSLASEGRSFTEILQFWREPDTYGTELDPVAESRRLRENQALGRPPTTGATPTIERRERGILEGLF
ncbi:DUF3035 domain-containing protein [Roseospira visakhapatnamensis]|uniref:Beta-barrel assembly complex subunit BamF n=1 Tax=Roseospira visakhapatnamensis TaxID=390880 RepID=A0A7W6W8Q7_9PROT|nr:DUF3035 domain-containing protein [Roseospira visakhapatnamensis]MBB4265114.1 hypothetical protein [Roseospira visakhapatnamensis]